MEKYQFFKNITLIRNTSSCDGIATNFKEYHRNISKPNEDVSFIPGHIFQIVGLEDIQISTSIYLYSQKTNKTIIVFDEDFSIWNIFDRVIFNYNNIWDSLCLR